MNLIKICKSAKKSAGDLAVLSNPKRNKILEDLSKRPATLKIVNFFEDF